MLFVPIWDMNHLKRVRFQYVTVGLIVLNTLIYFVFGTHLFLHSPASFVDALAFKPREVTTIHDFMEHVPEHFRLLTYMFMHGSVWHLPGEHGLPLCLRRQCRGCIGHGRFIVFYLLCGVIAAVVHSVVTVSPDVPLIGASGAIAGVIGSYVILHPERPGVRVLFPVPVVSFLPLRFSAAFVIGMWIMYQIASGLFLTGEATAWWAHVGGFFAERFSSLS